MSKINQSVKVSEQKLNHLETTVLDVSVSIKKLRDEIKALIESPTMTESETTILAKLYRDSGTVTDSSETL